MLVGVLMHHVYALPGRSWECSVLPLLISPCVLFRQILHFPLLRHSKGIGGGGTP